MSSGIALLVHYATLFYLAVVALLFTGYHGSVVELFVALQNICTVVIAGDDVVFWYMPCMLSVSSSLTLAYPGGCVHMAFIGLYA